MKRFLPLIQVLTVLLVFAGCSKRPEVRKVESTPEPIVDLVRFFVDYGELDSLDRLVFEDENEEILTAYMKVVAQVDTLSECDVEAWSTSPVVRMFGAAVDSVYSSLAALESSLGYTLAAADTFGIALPERSYAAVVYGKPVSMLFVDSTLLVAMNHYLGAEFEGYSHMPAYRRQYKTPQQLPYDLAEALAATQYPYSGTPEQQTLLSAMLYNGALAYATTLLVPNADIATTLGYSHDELEWLNVHEAEIWKTIVGRGLLYEVSPSLNERFVNPAPAVRIDGIEWPARVGRYIGYKIILSYIKNNTLASPAQLLTPEIFLAQNTLADARYNP